MAKVPNGVEKLPKISTGWVGCTSVTDDRQTDRQTDGRATAYSERELRSRSLKTKCMPMLLYGVVVCPLSTTQLSSIDFIINIFLLNSSAQTTWKLLNIVTSSLSSSYRASPWPVVLICFWPRLVNVTLYYTLRVCNGPVFTLCSCYIRRFVYLYSCQVKPTLLIKCTCTVRCASFRGIYVLAFLCF